MAVTSEHQQAGKQALYKENAPSLADGDRVSTLVDATGQIKIHLGTKLDPGNNKVAVFHDYYSSAVIETATTTVVSAGAGYIGSIRVIGGTLGDVTVYDNTAASGTKVVPTETPVKGQLLEDGCYCATGITIVTAAATKLKVRYHTDNV
jgi:hypothetical protein